MRKKASLNISVQAIIILIFAITILGLGLGFIRGMFGKVTTQLEQQIASEPDPPTPSSATPVTVSREIVVSTRGEQQIFKVGVYNSGGTEVTDKPFINCISGDPPGSQALDEQDANDRTIAPRGKENIVLIFTVPEDFEEKTYLCKVGFPTVEPIKYKDVTIKVTA